jgi:zinc transporter 11
VFVANEDRKLLDASLGFSAGVMLAASYWSLLAPAIEEAEANPLYGKDGEWAFVPVSIGFALGAAFVYGADILLPYLGFADGLDVVAALKKTDGCAEPAKSEKEDQTSALRSRKKESAPKTGDEKNTDEKSEAAIAASKSWRRTVLLALAVTIHNIPEGLAVGVGFGAIGNGRSTFAKARNLAIGIGIQNFPEGLAVSLPLHRAGYSTMKAFWYGQMSGMVEPVAGILGALAVSYATPILPYALAFAAGAMVYVVLDDIVPEYQEGGNQKLGTWGAIFGFIVMMSLDVGLG